MIDTPEAAPLRSVLADPAATELAATELAAHAAQLDPACLVIWDEPQSAVPAHVVGRELGCGVVRAYEHEGLVVLIDPVARDARALVLAASFETTQSLQALIGVAVNRGLNVVGVAVLDATPAVTEFDSPLPVLVARPATAPEQDL